MNKDNGYIIAVAVSSFVLGMALMYAIGVRVPLQQNAQKTAIMDTNQGVEIPVHFGDLGRRMSEAGVFKEDQFLALYDSRGGLSANEKALVTGTAGGNIRVTQENAGVLLNLLWAFGLSNKNQILEKGPMMDPRYGGAGNFASTGGWTLAAGGAMKHYSAHAFVTLTEAEQALVEKVAQNIYRPCCGNSTYFPDCNHGMAMLGLLELMASQGASGNDMYKAALALNSYWFPNEYMTIGRYLASRGSSLSSADPKEILGKDYSSGYGFARIAASLPQVPDQGGNGGCGLDTSAAAAPQQKQGGCGL